jgi:uncharacterized membrane protein HdeD (DUF308 family)
MLSKIFKVLSILSGLILLIYGIFTWNNLTNKSIFTMDIIGLCMFVFGGIDFLLSKQKKMKIMGIFYFAVAIFTSFVLIFKYA